MTIWKFPFGGVDTFSISMPKGASLLHVDVQRGQPCLWALVDPEMPKESRRFVVYGTGLPVDKVGEHVGSFQMMNESLVFHLFEAVP